MCQSINRIGPIKRRAFTLREQKGTFCMITVKSGFLLTDLDHLFPRYNFLVTIHENMLYFYARRSKTYISKEIYLN